MTERNDVRRLLARATGRGVALAILGMSATAALAATLLPGDTWASIAQLPDWSGTWALTREGHEFGTKEAHSVAPNGSVGFVPFTPAAAKSLLQAQKNNKTVNLANCLPAGVPGVMLHTIDLEWLFTPGRVTMLTEDGEVRRIYTNVSTHLDPRDFENSYEGYSVGHWEHGALVVHTTHFPNGTLLKDGYLMATPNTQYDERIFLKDKDHIEIDSVISDPARFTKPYASTRIYERLQDAPLIEPQCATTSRDLGGKIDLTPPAE